MKAREQGALKALVEEHGGARLRAQTLRARVVKADAVAAAKADLLHPRYAIDVQPQRAEGGDDDEWPVLRDVEMPVLWAGPNRGVYGLPAVGSLVRIGFYYDDPSQPYVAGILGTGWGVPAVAMDELIIAVSDEVRVVLTPTGVKVHGPAVELGGATPLMKCLYTGSDHPSLPLTIKAPGG